MNNNKDQYKDNPNENLQKDKMETNLFKSLTIKNDQNFETREKDFNQYDFLTNMDRILDMDD